MVSAAVFLLSQLLLAHVSPLYVLPSSSSQLFSVRLNSWPFLLFCLVPLCGFLLESLYLPSHVTTTVVFGRGEGVANSKIHTFCFDGS